ncbi:MAG: hypothetical protein KAS72_13630 [Phycisphaerales bacterium]|nr:hypothetical protein [Phycisphaerales bacterium]
MTPEAKLIQLAQRLLERSQEGKVNWRFDQSDDDYYVLLEFGILSLSIITNTALPDVARLGLFRGVDDPIVLVRIDETEPEFQVLYALYSEARRKVSGWDEVLAKLEKAIDSGEEIGADLPPPPQPIDEDDIPF